MYEYRRVVYDDSELIHEALKAAVHKVRVRDTKSWFSMLDATAALPAIMGLEHAYVVNESYLVCYAVEAPWYSSQLVLHELLVLKIGKHSAFDCVPAFLTDRAREAGCKLAVVGTALAANDAALASLYYPHGFELEALTLVKEVA